MSRWLVDAAVFAVSLVLVAWVVWTVTTVQLGALGPETDLIGFLVEPPWRPIQLAAGSTALP